MMDPSAYVHWSVDPELIRMGPLAIRYYGLGFVFAFGFGLRLMRTAYRSAGRVDEKLSLLLWHVMAGALIGARLGHCLLYDPAYYLTHPFVILWVWRGGLASHGGAIGIFASLYLYSRRQSSVPYLWLLDQIVVPTALAGALIRLGNLFNSGIYGQPTLVPWAFVFTRIDPLPRHPTQLYESLAYGLIFVLLLWLHRTERVHAGRGLLLGLFLVLVFTFRFLVEFLKVPQESYAHHLPLNAGQLLSLPMVGLGLWLLVRLQGPGRDGHCSPHCRRAGHT
jgi:prolipoprotein diacylglyceryl transferase